MMMMIFCVRDGKYVSVVLAETRQEKREREKEKSRLMESISRPSGSRSKPEASYVSRAASVELRGEKALVVLVLLCLVSARIIHL